MRRDPIAGSLSYHVGGTSGSRCFRFGIQGVSYHPQQLLPIDRLGQRASRSQFLGAAQVAFRAVQSAPGHGDDFDVGEFLFQLDDQADPVLVRHDQVGDDQVGRPLSKEPDALDPIRSLYYSVPRPLEDEADHRPDLRFVVDDKDAFHEAVCLVRIPPNARGVVFKKM